MVAEPFIAITEDADDDMVFPIADTPLDVHWAYIVIAGIGVPVALAFIYWTARPIRGVNLHSRILSLAMSLAQSVTPRRSTVPHATLQQRQSGAYRVIVIILASLFLFLYAGSENSFGTWVFTYAHTVHPIFINRCRHPDHTTVPRDQSDQAHGGTAGLGLLGQLCAGVRHLLT